MELLEGPWEYTAAAGIRGIFITVNSSLLETNGAAIVDWQTVDIRVYHRNHGRDEEAQYFSPPLYRRLDGAREENYATDLRNRRLIIQYGLDLELVFDAAAKHWTGTWTERGASGVERQEVILEQPHGATGLTINHFVGDWERTAGSSGLPFSGSLHIRESADGKLTAWLDRKLSAFNPRSQSTRTDLRNGERQEIYAEQEKVALSTTSAIAPGYHYAGKLSLDGENLAGEWLTEGSGPLAAPANFIRKH